MRLDGGRHLGSFLNILESLSHGFNRTRGASIHTDAHTRTQAQRHRDLLDTTYAHAAKSIHPFSHSLLFAPVLPHNSRFL